MAGSQAIEEHTDRAHEVEQRAELRPPVTALTSLGLHTALEPSALTARPAIRVSLPNGMRLFTTARARRELKYVYNEILHEDRCYEQRGIEYRDNSVVIDVGANFGLFALRVQQLAPNSRVFCFEPVPPTYACLAKNLEGHRGFSTYNLALSNQESMLEMTYYPHAPGNSTLDPRGKLQDPDGFAREATLSWLWRANKLLGAAAVSLYPIRRSIVRWAIASTFRDAETYKVRSTTLNRLFTEQRLASVDLLKIDVEGAEKDVLDGLSDENLSRVRQLVMEISGHHKAWIAELEARLRRCGFQQLELQSIIPEGDVRHAAVPCTLYARQAAAPH